MTAVYDQPGVSYDAITWSYDGTELNLGPYDPTVYLDATNALRLYARSGPLVAPRVTGRLASPMTASDRLRVYSATGIIRS